MGVVGIALRGFGKALTHGKNWSKARVADKGIKAKKTKDLSKLDLVKKELKILTAKAKATDKLAKDVEANPHLFKAGTAFKKGHGKFGFTQPSSKPKKTIQKTKHYYAPKDF